MYRRTRADSPLHNPKKAKPGLGAVPSLFNTVSKACELLLSRGQAHLASCWRGLQRLSCAWEGAELVPQQRHPGCWAAWMFCMPADASCVGRVQVMQA